MKFSLFLIFITSLIVTSFAYETGKKSGFSQCYPYAVSHSEAMKQGGNHE